MGYTEQNLGKNESVVLKCSVNMIAIIPYAILAALIVIICYIFHLLIIGLIIAAIIVGLKYLIMINTELSLTNKKIIGKVGVISTKVMDSPLNKINNISVEQGLGGKILVMEKLLLRQPQETIISISFHSPMFSEML